MGNLLFSSRKSRTGAWAALLLCLTMACGGGGGGSSAGPSTPAAVSPTFTIQPANQAVTEGQNASFSAQASGNPSPTYQWERSPDGTTWTAISGATQASYTFTAQTADNGAQFRVIASNSAGSATSGVALLSVTPTTTPTVPTFTQQPTALSVASGQTAAFYAQASGNPSPTYQWERSPDGMTWTAISGATQASYTFTAQTADNGAQFRAIASNSAGSATSGVALLSVTPTTTPTVPTFTQQPTALTVASGQTAAFYAQASGNPSPTYQWERSPDGTTWTAISGATQASYTFTAQTADNGAQFRAIAINDQGIAISSVAVLTVTASGTYSIVGKIVDSSNVGLPAVTVTFMGNAAGSCATDANGNYTIPGLANGSYVLTPSKTG